MGITIIKYSEGEDYSLLATGLEKILVHTIPSLVPSLWPLGTRLPYSAKFSRHIFFAVFADSS